jgi:hypothetical protein
MDIFKVLLDQFLANPVFQGAMVSILVAKIRDFFQSVDSAAKDPAQVKWVQILVMGLSLLATLLTGWVSGKLHEVDPQAVINFVTVLLAAFGTHQVGKDIKSNVSK